MEVHRSQQFARWVNDLVARAKAGDEQALKVAQHAFDELTYLRNLDAEPTEDTATLKRVRQSKKYPVWRLSHRSTSGNARTEVSAMSDRRIPEDAPGGFAPADDVFAALESIPGLHDNQAARDSARDQMERAHKMGLSMIRRAAELTQTEVADRLGVKQTSVSRLEARPDMLMSTLRNYLDAAGAEHPRIVVTIAGTDYEVDLEAFA